MINMTYRYTVYTIDFCLGIVVVLMGGKNTPVLFM